MTPEAFAYDFPTQRDLVADVLALLPSVPEQPTSGEYLSLEEAHQIVTATIQHSYRTDSAQEHEYLKGHRYRLAVSLSMIPKAENSDSSCLDIGCYGYMAFWAWRYLGYANVEGIEMRPGQPDVIVRRIEIDGHILNLPVRNFSIEQEHWPVKSQFDTILFFETLEHVGHDPSGVMLNVTRLMGEASTLVMSVPNSVSYQTLREFMTGAPPWTYWFFRPDLSHEPRHSFEYTPIFLKIFLRCAGLAELCFRTIISYAEEEDIRQISDIGHDLSVNPKLFGDTMIVQAKRVSDEPLFRYPDCIYDADRYYESTYPLLRPLLNQACFTYSEKFKAIELRHSQLLLQHSEQLQKVQELLQKTEKRAREAEKRSLESDQASKEALFLCDVYRSRLDTAEQAYLLRYQEIVSSGSWRLTKPLRMVLDYFKVLRSRLR
jgi:2-polyprenyl-3-methyl-5-hydroxy-6-metoxy-1,4-benzoquinol methylase